MDLYKALTWRFSLRHLLALVYLMSINLLVAVSEDEECVNLPPGVWQMNRGVDITQLDLIPLDFQHNNGFTSPLIKFTCNEKRTYVDRSKTYQLPDQVWHVANKPGGWLSADVHLYKTPSDLRSRMAKDVAGGLLRRFFFSFSGSYVKFQKSLIYSEKYISDVSSLHSSKRVELKPAKYLDFDKIAKQQLKKIVGNHTYLSNPAAYQRFIDKFGTHYISVGNFGGYIRYVPEIDTEYFITHTDEEVKAEARATFNYFISADGGIADSSIAEKKHFKAISNKQLLFYGGNVKLQSSGSVHDWQSTVDEKPWLLSIEVKSISGLIRKDDKRSSMKKAVLQHVLKAKLVELRRVLKSLISKHGGSPEITSSGKSLADLEAKPNGTLVEGEIERLDTSINDLVSQLSHSTDKTQTLEPISKDRNGNGHTVLNYYLVYFITIIIIIIIIIIIKKSGLSTKIRRFLT